MATLEQISDAFYQYSLNHRKEEIKNSEKPSERTFPSKNVFQEDFQTKINAIYNDLFRNYPPEQANYIYKTLLLNLSKQSEKPEQSKMLDLSKGTLNLQKLQNYSKKVQETLKVRHPEKFKGIEHQETQTQVESKPVDFNNPEETKQYFNNLFEEYHKLKTFDEKLKFFNDNFYDISDLDEKQQKIMLTAYETGKLVDKKETEYLETGFDEKEAHEKAIDDVKEETGREREEIEKCSKLTEVIESKSIYYEMLRAPELSEDKREEIYKKLEELEKQEKDLREELNEKGQSNINVDKEKEDNTLLGKAVSFNEIREQIQNQENNTGNLFLEPNNELLNLDALLAEENQSQDRVKQKESSKEDLFEIIDDAFDMEELMLAEPEKEENLEDTQNINTPNVEIPKDTYINSNLMENNEFTSEEIDYTQEIKENPFQKVINAFRARILNRTKMLNEGQAVRGKSQTSPKQGIFSGIKSAISKFINRNQPLTIGTAEDNQKIAYEKAKSAFDESLIVSEEEQKRYKDIYEKTKNNNGKTRSNGVIQVDDRNSK